MSLTLHQLQVFETVSRHLSITKASRELHVSQPSVFQQVKFLEDYCRVKLYLKVGRRIELTREGMSLRTDVLNILQQVESLQQKFGITAINPRAGSLTIGGSHAISISILLSLLASFKKTHPLVQVTLRTGSSPRIERFILNSQAEVGIVTNPSGSPAFCIEPYRKEKVVAFCATRYPLAKRRSLSLLELAQTPLIIRRGRLTKTRQHLNQVEQKGLKLNILMECESAEAVKVATMKGMGVGFAYRDHIESELRTHDIKILKIRGLKSANAQSFILYQKDKPLTANARDFLHLTKRLH